MSVLEEVSYPLTPSRFVGVLKLRAPVSQHCRHSAVVNFGTPLLGNRIPHLVGVHLPDNSKEKDDQDEAPLVQPAKLREVETSPDEEVCRRLVTGSKGGDGSIVCPKQACRTYNGYKPLVTRSNTEVAYHVCCCAFELAQAY